MVLPDHASLYPVSRVPEGDRNVRLEVHEPEEDERSVEGLMKDVIVLEKEMGELKAHYQGGGLI